MNNTEASRFRAYSVAIEHLKKNTAITDTVPAIKEVVEEAAALVAIIEEADNKRLIVPKTGTAGKYQYMGELAEKALIISSAIFSYASRINNQELKNSMSFTRTELDYANDTDLASRTSNILTTAKQLIGELKNYGITEDMINDFSERVNNLRIHYTKPRFQTADRKAARLAAGDQLRRLQYLFDEQLDKLMLQFREKYNEFYNSYIIKRTYVSPSSRKTRVEGTVADIAGAGIGEVLIRFKDSELATTSLPDGSFSLKSGVFASVQLEFIKEGYKTLTVTVSIKRGQILVQSVTLEKL